MGSCDSTSALKNERGRHGSGTTPGWNHPTCYFSCTRVFQGQKNLPYNKNKSKNLERSKKVLPPIVISKINLFMNLQSICIILHFSFNLKQMILTLNYFQVSIVLQF